MTEGALTTFITVVAIIAAALIGAMITLAVYLLSSGSTLLGAITIAATLVVAAMAVGCAWWLLVLPRLPRDAASRQGTVAFNDPGVQSICTSKSGVTAIAAADPASTDGERQTQQAGQHKSGESDFRDAAQVPVAPVPSGDSLDVTYPVRGVGKKGSPAYRINWWLCGLSGSAE